MRNHFNNEGKPMNALMTIVTDKPILGYLGSAGSAGAAILVWCGYISAIAGAVGAVIGASLVLLSFYVKWQELQLNRKKLKGQDIH